MNSNTAVAAPTTIDVVDDVELLAILGLSSPPSSPSLCDTNQVAVLDWDDMPELSEEEDEDDNTSIKSNNKRKYNDEEEDIFAEFDFVEVAITEPEQKKQKTLLIQQPFVSEDDNAEALLNSNMNLQLDEDIRLALDLISSSN